MGGRGYIAVDLGAESGRVIVGWLTGEAGGDARGSRRLELHEAYRFMHGPVQCAGALRWDIERLWGQVVEGLRLAGEWSRGNGVELVSVGVDTWGVDFALLDGDGAVMESPRCYRDARHASGMEWLRERLGMDRLFGITGIQEMTINTLTQLAAAVKSEDGAAARAKRMLFMPSLFHFLLSGTAVNELSIASTSQMLDASTVTWAPEILKAAGIASGLLGEPVAAGTTLGMICAEIAAKTGLPAQLRVVTPASHDTASAVAAVPGRGEGWAYLSSGTWSLMGVELAMPVLSVQAHRYGFSNERGIGSTVRFQKNLSGLWLVQEVRRDLERTGTVVSYEQMTHAAEAASPFRIRIDASDATLASPGGIIEKLREIAARVGDPAPKNAGELVRCCLEAIAMDYRRCAQQLEELLGRRLEVIHVVGGGSRNALLCQMTADATGKRVLAGPVEATAAGNVLVQAMANGQLKDAAVIREIVAGSTDLLEYRPRDVSSWDAAYVRHRQVWNVNA